MEGSPQKTSFAPIGSIISTLFCNQFSFLIQSKETTEDDNRRRRRRGTTKKRERAVGSGWRRDATLAAAKKSRIRDPNTNTKQNKPRTTRLFTVSLHVSYNVPLPLRCCRRFTHARMHNLLHAHHGMYLKAAVGRLSSDCWMTESRVARARSKTRTCVLYVRASRLFL
jgi:hypothetical protein